MTSEKEENLVEPRLISQSHSDTGVVDFSPEPHTVGGMPRALQRALRGFRRQTPMMAIVAGLTWAVGGGYLLVFGYSLEAAMVWVVFGALLAAILALVRETARSVIYDIASARRFANVGAMSASPSILQDQLRALPPDARTPMGWATYFPGSAYAASVRDLAHNIGDAQVVAFLGTHPQDGATSTAAAIAVMARQNHRRVLLVDCDLRRRELTHMLDLDANEGVLEALTRPEACDDLIRVEAETGIEVMPAARLRNLWAAFKPAALQRLLSHWRTQYDLIVLDCPPSATNADGAVIARFSDFCVLVAAWDETPSDSLRQTIRRFRGQAASRLALHVNRAPRDFVAALERNAEPLA